MKKISIILIILSLCVSLSFAADGDNLNNNTSVNEVQLNTDTQEAVNDTTVSIKTEDASVNTEVKKSDDFRFSVEGFLGFTGRFGYGGFIPGGTASVGFNFIPEMTLSFYIHGEYFSAPLGSKTGELVGFELELEAGLNFMFPIFTKGVFSLRAGVDFGYYMQWLQYNSRISTLAHLSFNGLMIRPMLNFMFYKLWNMPLSLSLFYQVTAIGVYTPYNGFGFMVTI